MTFLFAGKADLAKAEMAAWTHGSCGGHIREVHWSAEPTGGDVLVDSVGPTLRGAAKCCTLQEGLRRPLSISGRSGDTMVCGLACVSHTVQVSPARKLFDTMLWAWLEPGCQSLGRSTCGKGAWVEHPRVANPLSSSIQGNKDLTTLLLTEVRESKTQAVDQIPLRSITEHAKVSG